MTDAFIYDALRTPRGRGKPDGALHEVTAVALAACALGALRDRCGIDTGALEDVILGCVTQAHEQGGGIARAAALYAGYAETAPGLTINRFCASGLEAVNLAAAQIRAGAGDLYVAGGVESMSRVAMASDGFPMAVDPVLAIGAHFVPQGIAADLIATLRGFSRADLDGWAVESQRRAARAWEEGRFARSVVPVRDPNGLNILSRDEHLRPGADMQSLGALKPAFREQGETMPGFDAVALLKHPELERIEHLHHAGNSSGVVDGAAAALLGSRAAGERLGLTPRARVRATARVGTDPTIMLTGPLPATEKALAAAGMAVGDVDLFEVNEAFAAIPLMFIDHFGVDPARVNPCGGAIALGHPLGATGAMLLGTALDELERSGGGVALVTLCVAAGMGVATVIERV